MPLDASYPIPQNNLRLPDALTVQYGPARLLSRFVLAADRAVRRRGLTLRLRHDFDELLDLSKFYAARDLWYPLCEAIDPQYQELTPANAFWIATENENGEVVATNACRVADWTGTSLAEQASRFWYGTKSDEKCILTADAAPLISGVVAWGGAAWVRPDYRGRQLSYLTPRLMKAYACARWPVEWSFCYISTENLKRGLAATYGHQNLSYSIRHPNSLMGEMAVVYSSSAGFYADIADFMESGGIIDENEGRLPRGLEHIVTKTSPEGVFHGSISRS